MNNKTVFVRTSKGEAEASGQTSLLFGDAKRAFILVNNQSNLEDLRKHAAPSLRPHLEEILEQLVADQFIRDKSEAAQKNGGAAPRMSVPKITVPTKAPMLEEQREEEEEGELDFTSSRAHPPVTVSPEEPAGGGDLDFSSIVQQPTQAEAAAKAKAEAEARARAEAEAKARAETEARMRAEAEAKAKARAELEAKMRAEAAAKARAEMEAKMKAEAENKAWAQAEAKMRADAEAAAKARAEQEARMRAEAEAKTRAEIEARMRLEAEVKARAEAETRARAEAEARARAEAEIKARAEAEARARAEAEAKARAEAEARAREAEAKARAEVEARIRAEAEAKAKAEAAAKSQGVPELDFSAILQQPAAADAERVRMEAEARARLEVEARMRAEAEAKSRQQAELDAKMRAEAEARARLRAELEAGMRATPAPGAITGKNQAARSMIATVLFFDVVGYTKQSVAKQIELKGQFNALISALIGHVDEDQRIILDTGDGAAIGFLQHPEDALDVAMKFRSAVTANNHRSYPELIVRAGIHLGPVNVVKDMNGQLNMVGDGINDAQRIMSFAGADQIYVSRAYFDVVSRLTADAARLFKYQGTQKDKHGREHQLYQVLGEGGMPAAAAAPRGGGVESLLEDLSSLLRESAGQAAAPPAPPPARPAQPTGEWQPLEIPQTERRKTPQELEAEARRAAQIQAEQAAEAARARAQQEAAARARAEEEAARARQEEAARKLAADQAKAFAEAERRAKEAAEAEERAQAKAQARATKKAEKAAAVRKPRAAGRVKAQRTTSWLSIGIVFVIVAVAAVVGLPYLWPMQDYIPRIEAELGGQLKQPVHIGSISAVSVPAPRLDLQDVSIGAKQEVKIGHVALYFAPLSLPSNVKEIRKAELENVEISAEAFGAVLSWVQGLGSDERYPLAQIVVQSMRVSGDVPPLPSLGGEVKFDSYGHVTSARISTKDEKLELDVEPRANKHWQLEVSVKDGSLPLLPNIKFSGLDATGDMFDGTVTFGTVSGSLYGGSLKGSANLNWQGGWQLQGRLNVRGMPVQSAVPGLRIEGDLAGDANFSMSAARLSQLGGNPRLDGTFQVTEGAIKGLDVGETARSGARQLVAGATHFDVMSGTLRADSTGQHVKSVKITSGAMTMTGSADAGPDGRLVGQLLVDLNRVRAGMGTLPLALSGTVAEPVWALGH